MEHFDSFKKQKPSRGNLLISEPYLMDPNFERTVILLCEHDENGSLGFVLNKLSELSLAEVIEGAPNKGLPLYIGGPVQQDTLHFIHRSQLLTPDSVLISENIYWGRDFDRLLSLLGAGRVVENEVRLFVGYSGWSEGQLAKEIEENSWIVNKNVESEYIFEYSHLELWRQVLKDMGGRFRMFSNFPADPRLN